MTPVNAVFVAQPNVQSYVNPFDDATLDPPFRQLGTPAVGGGALLAVQVTGGVLRPNATTVRDWNGFWRNPLTSWDQTVRFTLGNNLVNGQWFSSCLLRAWDGAVDGGTDNYVYAHFRGGLTAASVYLGHYNSATQTDWASNTNCANLASGGVIELSAVGNVYTVVFETSAGVRTTAATYTDAGNTFPYSGSGPAAFKWCGLRIGYNGGDSPWCSKIEFRG